MFASYLNISGVKKTRIFLPFILSQWTRSILRNAIFMKNFHQQKIKSELIATQIICIFSIDSNSKLDVHARGTTKKNHDFCELKKKWERERSLHLRLETRFHLQSKPCDYCQKSKVERILCDAMHFRLSVCNFKVTLIHSGNVIRSHKMSDKNKQTHEIIYSLTNAMSDDTKIYVCKFLFVIKGNDAILVSRETFVCMCIVQCNVYICCKYLYINLFASVLSLISSGSNWYSYQMRVCIQLRLRFMEIHLLFSCFDDYYWCTTTCGCICRSNEYRIHQRT